MIKYIKKLLEIIGRRVNMIEISNGKRIGNYKKMPNRKKSLITKEFCEDFRENLIKHAEENDKNRGCKVDYSNECYMGFYSYIEGTYLFYDALKETCIKHNVIKAIYDYAKNMPWYDSDCFDDDLVLRMVDFGIIPYTTEEWESSKDFILDEAIEYEIIYHYKSKGYSVSEYGAWDKNDKSGLEEIYRDVDNIEIVWK